MIVRDKSAYNISSWTTDTGLPQNAIKCLIQTHDGFLWVGTQNGLARFDGRRFRVFDHASTPAMPHCNVYSLAEDYDGALWIGTSDGLARFTNGDSSLSIDPARWKPGANYFDNCSARRKPLCLGTSAGPRLFKSNHFLNFHHDGISMIAKMGEAGLLGLHRTEHIPVRFCDEFP